MLQDLDDRPVGDPFAVRQAASTYERGVADRPEELGCQTRLADARDSEDREQLARPVVDGLRECFLQAAQLALASNERRVEAAREGGSFLVQSKQAVGG